MLDPAEYGVILGAAVLTTFLCMFILHRAQNPREPHPDTDIALLFDGAHLYHGTDAALFHFGFDPEFDTLDDLQERLSEDFPGIAGLHAEARHGTLRLPGRNDAAGQWLEMTWRGDFRLLSLLASGDAREMPDPLAGAGIAQIQTLQRLGETAPHPAWQLDGTGTLTWCNSAYRILNQQRGAPEEATIFDPPRAGDTYTTTLERDDGSCGHFSVTATRIEDHLVCHATDIGPQVQAETTRRSFMQTLAKTFAHLPTGLAIFDRCGKLALFNPALVDLTMLPAPFLSGRPDILSFFDQMRENRRMPEPKDYVTWRSDIADLIRQASGNGYQDTWSLEDGRTFRVQARPHPDGATALMIDDITTEVLTTRSFRRELEMNQSLLDLMEDAIVVFSRSGALTFCNAAYRTLWKQDPESAFAEVTIHDCTRIWRAQTGSESDWRQVERFVKALHDPDPGAIDFVRGPVTRLEMSCFAPGSRLIRFRLAPAADRTGSRLAVTA
jgi:PAS domain-containing protein